MTGMAFAAGGRLAGAQAPKQKDMTWQSIAKQEKRKSKEYFMVFLPRHVSRAIPLHI